MGLARVASAAPVTKKIPVGLELYTVRNECKADLAGTLAAVSKIGFRAVEFAGYWGHSAKDIRKMLDDNGLLACGSHTPYGDVQPGKFQATIEFNQTIGNKFVIVPDMTDKTRVGWLKRAAEFNELSDKLKPLGMSIGYHSHAHDFQMVEGELPWEIFGENTNPAVVMQLDTGNCSEGGGDVLKELKKFPGRTRSIHVKPFGAGPEAVITEDKLDWAAIFHFCETQGGTEWYVIEHETSQKPLDAMQRTYAVLQKLGKV